MATAYQEMKFIERYVGMPGFTKAIEKYCAGAASNGTPRLADRLRVEQAEARKRGWLSKDSGGWAVQIDETGHIPRAVAVAPADANVQLMQHSARVGW